MDEIAALTPTFAGVNYERRSKSMVPCRWPVNEDAPRGTPTMHLDGFHEARAVRRHGLLCRPTRKTGPRFPLLLTTGRVLSHYNVGAQTRRTDNVACILRNLLEVHPSDARTVVSRRRRVLLRSRAGETTLRAKVTDRVRWRRVYDFSSSRRGKCNHNGLLGLGYQLPRI